MAVYERTWRRYQGELTPLPWRFLVVTRYALTDAFASRLFTALYAVCFLPSVIGLFFIYFSHNASLLQQLGAPKDLMDILTAQFFMILFSWQALPAFLVAVIVSPSLIAADLANNALPLYLARPIDRREYVLGKMAVLAILLSPMTWVMGLLPNRPRIPGRSPRVDRRNLPAHVGDLGLGAVQTGGPGRTLRHHLHPRGLWHSGQRRHRHLLGRSH